MEKYDAHDARVQYVYVWVERVLENEIYSVQKPSDNQPIER